MTSKPTNYSGTSRANVEPRRSGFPISTFIDNFRPAQRYCLKFHHFDQYFIGISSRAKSVTRIQHTYGYVLDLYLYVYHVITNFV